MGDKFGPMCNRRIAMCAAPLLRAPSAELADEPHQSFHPRRAEPSPRCPFQHRPDNLHFRSRCESRDDHSAMEDVCAEVAIKHLDEGDQALVDSELSQDRPHPGAGEAGEGL